MDFSDVLVLIRQLVNLQLFEISGHWVTPMTIFTVGLLAAATWILSNFVQRAVERTFRARGVHDVGTIQVTRRLLHYSILAVGLAIVLDTLGIPLGALFTAGAIFAVGLGFAMQDIARNFVSGLILLVEGGIRPGDVVEVEERVVRVRKMGIRTTVARTRDEEDIIIPNATLAQTSVKNFTYRDSLYRIRAHVGVEYGSNMRNVRETLDSVGRSLPGRIEDRDPVVLLSEFGDSSVVWQLSVWISDPWRSNRQVSELNQAIWWALKDAGITIAFPQLDVHLDPPVTSALERLPQPS